MQLVKAHYANKPVSPIPTGDGSGIVDLQIKFFHELRTSPRERRRFKVCGLVNKYLNNTIFAKDVVWRSEKDPLVREVGSGLLELLWPLRYHTSTSESGKVRQSTGEELRSHILELCDEAESLATMIRSARAQCQFVMLEPGISLEPSVLAVASVLLAKGALHEPDRTKRIAECIFGCLLRQSAAQLMDGMLSQRARSC